MTEQDTIKKIKTFWLIAESASDLPFSSSYKRMVDLDRLPNLGENTVISELSFSYAYKRVSDLDKLPHSGGYAVIIDTAFAFGAIEELVKKFRQMEHYNLTPLFYMGDITEKTRLLFDGCFDESVLSKAEQINGRLEKLQDMEATALDLVEYQPLAWLFSRPDSLLQGVLDYKKPDVLCYPLIELYRGEDSEIKTWDLLQSMLHRGLLSIEALTDEIQVCNFCSSGLLNFKNCCPNCNSINIKNQKLIHCFSCGNIAPFEKNLSHERLVCNRCNTRLRHIGIDYDIPIEDKQCNECDSIFMEPQINVNCLVCKRSIPPEDLITRRLYDYMLTRRGENIVQGVEQSLSQDFGNFFDFIDFSAFNAIIVWQTQLAKRYKQTTFSMLAIQIDDFDELIERLGLSTVEVLLTQLFSYFKDLLRDSDLATRKEELLIFFLPMTNGKNVDVIKDRIRQYINKQLHEKNKLADLQLKLASIDSDEIVANDLQGELLLVELNNRVENE